MSSGVIVIGVGNRYRGDDAAGIEVARRVGERAPELEVVEHEREPTALLELWAGAELAIVVDAARAADAPGRVHRFEVGRSAIPVRLSATTSTHAFDLAETIELARSLGRLPARLVVYGIEGDRFETGERLSPEVERAIEEVAGKVLAETEA